MHLSLSLLCLITTERCPQRQRIIPAKKGIAHLFSVLYDLFQVLTEPV